MITKSLAELAKPDERGLHFTPFGIAPKMDAEAAAQYEQVGSGGSTGTSSCSGSPPGSRSTWR